MENIGIRAPPPPYLEALSYPLTAEEKDEEETEVKKKPCIQWERKCSPERQTSPEVPNAESTSLYPISMLSLQFPSSNSECSDNSSETTLKKVPIPSRCTSVPLAKGALIHNCTVRDSRNSCSDINQIQTPKPHENLGVSENSSESSSELSSESETCQSLRPYSPQPGPSGYNGVRGKARAHTGMAVKFNNREGVYRVVTTSESSDNIYSTNCTTSITDLDEERDNSAADRGTLYCACGILISIVTLVLLLVNFA